MNFYKIEISNLMHSQRAKKNIPQLIAIYLSRKMGLYTYSQIGKIFKKNSYAINVALKRFKKQLCCDANAELKVMLVAIEENIRKKIGTDL